MENHPDETTQTVCNGSNCLSMAEPRHKPAINKLKDTAFGSDSRRSPPISEGPSSACSLGRPAGKPAFPSARQRSLVPCWRGRKVLLSIQPPLAQREQADEGPSESGGERGLSEPKAVSLSLFIAGLCLGSAMLRQLEPLHTVCVVSSG